MNKKILIVIPLLFLLIPLCLASPDTETLRPNAAGDSSQCKKYPNTGVNYEKVDEVEPNNDTDYVYAGVMYGEIRLDLYNIPSTAIPETATINSINVYCMMRKYAYPEYRETTARIAIKIDGSVFYGLNFNPTNSWALYNKTWTTNPKSGNPWNTTAINALQIGQELYGIEWEYEWGVEWALAYCTQTYVITDYTPVPTEQWHVIETWTFDLKTREWSWEGSWNFDVITRNWSPIQSWQFKLSNLLTFPMGTFLVCAFIGIVCLTVIVVFTQRKKGGVT